MYCTQFIVAESLQFEEADLNELSQWLQSQHHRMSSFCPFDRQLAEPRETNSVKLVKSPFECKEGKDSLVSDWDGKWDKNGLPKGPGRLGRLKKTLEYQGKQKLIG